MGAGRRTRGMVTALAAVAAGCAGSGGQGDPPPPTRVGPATRLSPHSNGIDPAILPPRRVPRHATGAPDPHAVHVIRLWLRALRNGDIPRAASYFAIPSRFQNGTPVLTLDRRLEVLAVNVSFPCGAVAYRFRAAGHFTLVRYRLTPRRGGDCHGGEGHTTGGAIRVAGGRIREWYRLYDRREAKPREAEIDPGVAAA